MWSILREEVRCVNLNKAMGSRKGFLTSQPAVLTQTYISDLVIEVGFKHPYKQRTKTM